MISKVRKFLLLWVVSIPLTGFAGLIGQEFEVSYRFPNLGTSYSFSSFAPATFTVGAVQESTGNVEGVTFLHIDFSDDALTIELNTILNNPTWNAALFNGIVFEATQPHQITGASVDAVATTMGGFDILRASFDASQIFINWQGLSYVDGSVVKINFEFESRAVPTPGSLSLLGLGLLGLGVVLRRRSVRSSQ